MMKKQGVTVTMLVITIIILSILVGTVTFSVYLTIDYSKLSTWANEIIYIQDIVNEQRHKSSAIDFILGDVYIDVASVKNRGEQFEGETISGDNMLSLKILNLGKLKITNTIYGNLKGGADVYAISEQTGKVYYVKGLEVEGKTYYCITDGLRQQFELMDKGDNLSSVVFVPNIIGYTNQPINVLVKIPNTFTNITITTSNPNINIGEQKIKGTTYEYIVNGTSTPISSNYTITVTYNDGVKDITSIYEVNGYDTTPPVIGEITDSNFVYKSNETKEINYITNIVATDESGIKELKYELGEITLENADAHFKDNGRPLLGGKLSCVDGVKQYTIYAKDNAGNYSIYVVKLIDKVYAIYSGTDNSLTFIKTDKVINDGAVYNKKEVTAIYKDFIDSTYADLASVPWNTYRTVIKSVSVEDSISPVDIRNWFEGMTKCESLNLKMLDTSKVSKMTEVFYNVGNDSTVTNFKIYGLDNWDISKVITTDGMFRNVGAKATSWDIGDLSNWNVSNVTSMHVMFSGAGNNASKFNIGNLDNWDIANVTRLSFTFNCGINAKEWNIGKLDNWNTSKITTFGSMFAQAGEQATNWDIGDLSTKEVVREDGTKYMAWDVSNANYMKEMFSGAGRNSSKFDIGDLNNWDVSKVENMGYMFKWAGQNAVTWNIGDLSNWKVDNVTSMYQMFNYCGENASKWDIGLLDNWNVSNVTTMYQMFMKAGYASSSWKIGNLDNWNVSNVENMAGMFSNTGGNTTNFTLGNLDNWDTSSVENMNGMFQNAGAKSTTWNIGKLDKWNVSNVKNMGSMFGNAFSSTKATGQKLNIGDLSTKEVVRDDGSKYIAWDVSGVTYMSSMFNAFGRYATYDYPNGYLDISNWDVSSVTNYNYFKDYVGSKIKSPAFQ